MRKQLLSGGVSGVLLALLVLVMSGCVTARQAELATIQPRCVPQEGTVPILVPESAPMMELVPVGEQRRHQETIAEPRPVKPRMAPMPSVVPKPFRDTGVMAI